jgi:hypothetical protein
MDKEKRYVVTIDLYLSAENDYMARKRAHEVVNNGKFGKHAYNVALTAIDEQPFASLNSRKLEDISNPLNKVDDELPF